jgi:acetyltransferase-like isoleucine patch superfamily enzyme
MNLSLGSEIKMRRKSKNAVSKLSKIGKGVKVWDFSKVSDNAEVGENSIIGRSVYIGPGVKIGNNCKIQNNALLYEPAKLGNGVFIGPGVVLTNDLNPRAVTKNFALKSQNDWFKQGVEIEDGASIGAGSVCVAPLRVGKWALVGAGSVVIKDVPDFALVVGNPAMQIGWVGKSGFKLTQVESGAYLCESTRETYSIIDGKMSFVM